MDKLASSKMTKTKAMIMTKTKTKTMTMKILRWRQIATDESGQRREGPGIDCFSLSGIE